MKVAGKLFREGRHVPFAHRQHLGCDVLLYVRASVRIAALLAGVFIVTPPAIAQTSPVIRIGVGPNDQALPLVYADKAGLFAKAGLNVEVSPIANTSIEAAAISGGSLDIAAGSGLSAVSLVAKGLPFTIVGNLAFYSSEKPDAGLLVGAASAIQSPKDLEGGTLGTTGLEDMNSIATRKWLEQRGVDTAKIHYIEIPASASLSAIEQNRISATTLYEPFYSAAVASGKVRVLGHPWDSISPHFSTGVLFAGTKWAADHRDLITRVLRVIQDAATYAGSHENELASYTAQFTGLDANVVRSIHHPERGVAIVPSDLQPLIDMAVRAKMIPSAMPAQQMICSCALSR
jgi:NitT/TauT family transport system substrate-binding protein